MALKDKKNVKPRRKNPTLDEAQDDCRVRVIHGGDPDPDGRCVLLWMQRAQRALDNPALNEAIAIGNDLGKPVAAVFGLTADYPGAQRRHYRFLLDGLAETRDALAARGVPLFVRLGDPAAVTLRMAEELRPAIVIGDENPVRIGKIWRAKVGDALKAPFRLVDADVIVPTALFPKEEYAARTIRPKIHKVLSQYLRPYPELTARVPWPSNLSPSNEPIDSAALLAKLKVGGASEIPSYRGGTAEAMHRLKRFLDRRLQHYAEDRNQPTPYVTSELSAHLHFGHISPLTIALAVKAHAESHPEIANLKEGADVYLEEMIVRRELAINFVARNPQYDQLQGCPSWALATLAKHRDDRRPYLYDADRLERGETHDALWNAAQKEMVLTGRMHNYLRMYWAKKLLEWTPDAEAAFQIAVDLNDRYEMDGRDPNGYAGIAWAIGGKHDRPWPGRPIFGTVRYMSEDGVRRKLDAEAYIARVRSIEQGRAPADD